MGRTKERHGERLARRLQVAAELAAAAAVAGDLAQIYQQATACAASLLKAEWASVRVYDAASQRLVLRASSGSRPEPPDPALPPGQGTSGAAFATGQPVLTNAYAQFRAARPPTVQMGMRAGIAVPLRAGERIVGTLAVGTCQPITYDVDDVAVLDLFGRIVAAAVTRIEAQEQAERRAARLRALHEVALTLAQESDPEKVLRLVVARACRLMHADRATAWIWSETEQCLIAAAYEGYEGRIAQERVRAGEGAAGRAFATGRPVLVDDVRTWEGAIPAFRAAGLRGLIAVPLEVGTQRFGVLSASTMRPHAFDQEEIELYTLFAQQAATAVLHARALANQQAAAQRSERLATLHALVSEVAQQTDEQQVLQHTVEAVARLLRAEVVRLWLYDEAADEFVATAAHGTELVPIDPRLPRTALPLLDEALRSGRVVAVNDYPSHPQAWPSRVERGVTSLLAAPLVGDGRPLGGLVALSFTRHVWQPEDCELLSLLAHQAANALQGARRLAAREHAAKLDAALRMARTAADSIINPLAIAAGYLELLVHRGALGPQERSWAEEARQAFFAAGDAVHRLESVTRVVERMEGALGMLDLDSGGLVEEP